MEDSGIGIKKEIIPEIFKDFNQADLSTTRKYEGTGLGLAICKRLVEIQGGTIKVESEPGKGSKFQVQLTYDNSDQIPNQTSSIASVRPNGLNGGAKLLVVDDDKFNLRLLEVILKKWGLKVELCDNGNTAMNRLSTDQYDLVLTDINMPETSGLDLCSYIRSQSDPKKKNIPIVALTANVMENDIERYLDAGINDVLLKPYKEQDLFEKIKSYLDITQAKPSEVVAGGSFNLEDFKKFSGGDEAALLSILDSFHSNLCKNVQALETYSSQESLPKLAELAHKMISSFGHLQAHLAVETLREVEILARNGDSEGNIPKKVEQVVLLAGPVQAALHQEISELKESIAS